VLYIIYDHTHIQFKQERQKLKTGKYNGAYYYSKELVKNIIPFIKTDYNWITSNVTENIVLNHTIVICHDNCMPESTYAKYRNFEDIIFICSSFQTARAVEIHGNPIYIPMSIDAQYVSKFKTKKTKKEAFAGNVWGFKKGYLPENVDIITELPREQFLKEMAKYEKIYATGRTRLEAVCLGCETEFMKFPRSYEEESDLYDNKDVIKLIQNEIDKNAK
jgi:hypothetical protein